MSERRLYLFTGKGGVGKTTLSLAFANHLKKKGLTPKLIFLSDSNLSENSQLDSFSLKIQRYLESKNINSNFMHLNDTVENYIASRLKSKVLSKWICSTKFFQSIINIIPGFNFVIYLGKIMHDLENNPNEIFIIDGPASGHGQTLLHSVFKFREIFKSGILFKDCEKIAMQLSDPSFFKVNLISLPNIFSLNESKETYDNLKQLADFKMGECINQSLQHSSEQFSNQFLNKKAQIETIESSTPLTASVLPYIPQDDFFTIVDELSLKEVEGLE